MVCGQESFDFPGIELWQRSKGPKALQQGQLVLFVRYARDHCDLPSDHQRNFLTGLQCPRCAHQFFSQLLDFQFVLHCPLCAGFGGLNFCQILKNQVGDIGFFVPVRILRAGVWTVVVPKIFVVQNFHDYVLEATVVFLPKNHKSAKKSNVENEVSLNLVLHNRKTKQFLSVQLCFPGGHARFVLVQDQTLRMKGIPFKRPRG